MDPKRPSDRFVALIQEILTTAEGFRPRVLPVVPEHRLVEDLGLDSVALMDLAVGLEARLGRAVDESELLDLGTVGAIACRLAEA